MILYDYQLTALDEIRGAYRAGARAPLLVAATGSGKTVMFCEICRSAVSKGHVVWVLVHRQELIDQVSVTLKSFLVPHGIVSPQFPASPRSPVQVASVFSLSRRMATLPPPNLIVVDEAHHATLRTTWGKILAAFPKSRILGVTATPCRLSGEGLGDIFDRIVLGPAVTALIDSGRLSPVKIFAPPTIDTAGLHTKMGEFVKAELTNAVDKPKVTGDAIEHYQTLTPGKRAAVFCVSLDHAAHISSAARAAGISAVQIDGQMDRHLRRQIIKEFSDGKIQWLVSVDLISEGFDCPGIDVGISLRPTQSLGLWLQQCGRILRTAPGKNHATILDHAGNSLRHGLPTEQRSWSLSGTVAASKSDGERPASVRVCPSCFSAQRSGRPACANCGKPFPVDARTVAKEKGTLKEITQEDIDKRRARQEVGMTATLASLTQLGTMRNYKDPEAWARYVLAGREKKKAAR